MNSYFKTCVYTIFFAACLMLATGNAFAAKKSAGKKGYWKFRTRLIEVVPNDDSGEITNTQSGGTLPAGAGVESDRTLEIDFTYMLNPSFGFELILGTTRHGIVGTGALEGVDVGNTAVLPPTLTAQWHFMPNSKIRPYVGVGLNYTIFYAEYASKELEGALGQILEADPDKDGKTNPVNTSISLSSSMGLAKQFGMDIMIGKNAFINIDVKHIAMKTTATVTTASSYKANGATIGATEHEVDVTIDPWVIGVGVGMSF